MLFVLLAESGLGAAGGATVTGGVTGCVVSGAGVPAGAAVVFGATAATGLFIGGCESPGGRGAAPEFAACGGIGAIFVESGCFLVESCCFLVESCCFLVESCCFFVESCCFFVESCCCRASANVRRSAAWA